MGWWRAFQKLEEYEKESRLLVNLADTGRVVTILLQRVKTLTEVLSVRDVARLKFSRQQFMVERETRKHICETLLDDESKFVAAMGDANQQLEILTLIKHGIEIYGAVLTPRETNIILEVYEAISHHSDIVVGCIPSWVAPTTSTWPGAAKTVMEETGEDFLRQVAISSELRHPNVRKLYDACHVGTPFAIHEYSGLVSELKLSWRLLRGLLGGLQYVHERFFYTSELFICHSSEFGVRRKTGIERNGIGAYSTRWEQQRKGEGIISLCIRCDGVWLCPFECARNGTITYPKYQQDQELPKVQPAFAKEGK